MSEKSKLLDTEELVAACGEGMGIYCKWPLGNLLEGMKMFYNGLVVMVVPLSKSHTLDMGGLYNMKNIPQ